MTETNRKEQPIHHYEILFEIVRKDATTIRVHAYTKTAEGRLDHLGTEEQSRANSSGVSTPLEAILQDAEKRLGREFTFRVQRFETSYDGGAFQSSILKYPFKQK